MGCLILIGNKKRLVNAVYKMLYSCLHVVILAGIVNKLLLD